MVLYSSNTGQDTRKAERAEASRYLGYTKRAKDTSIGDKIEGVMDINKYYAAFPALVKSVPSYWTEAASPLPVQETVVTAESAVHSPYKQDNNKRNSHYGGGIGLSHSTAQRHSPKPPRRHVKNNSRCSPRPQCGSTANSKQVRQHEVSNGYRDVKRPRDKKRKPKLFKPKDLKPWKALTDINPTPIPCQGQGEVRVAAALQAKAESSWLLLPEDELEEVLSADAMAIHSIDIDALPNSLKDLWLDKSESSLDNGERINELEDKESADKPTRSDTQPDAGVCKNLDENLWNADALERGNTSSYESHAADPTLDGDWQTPGYAVAKESWQTDYRQIEAEMSALKFCEDVGSTLPAESRLTRVLEENPLSYMMRKAASNMADSSVSPYSNLTFSCCHCEESYEIVLEAEMQQSKPPYRSKLLASIDHRLDFDWTKYHPPPWSTAARDEPASQDCSRRRPNCDCDYCRSRIWRHTCNWCGTPA